MSFNKALVIAVMIIGVVAFFKSKMNTNVSEESISMQSEYVMENDDEHQSYTIHRADFNLASFSTIQNNRTPEKILIPTKDGREVLIPLKKIKYCATTANKGSKTEIHIDGDTTIIANMTIKKLKEKIIQPRFMYEEFQSYIINFDYVKAIERERYPQGNNYMYSIEMRESEKNIPISQGKQGHFKKALESYFMEIE
ncbi:MAG: LytTR family transcriptional regulator DNA-binding domain-containing protein [Saprospiraceae bacterium]